MDEKVFCGTIENNGNVYDVYWYPIDLSVVVSNRKTPNEFSSVGGPKAKNKQTALVVAKEMLDLNPLTF